MELLRKLSTKRFAVYGLGLTGNSVLRHLKRLNVKSICVWDDDKNKRFSYKKYLSKSGFSKEINNADIIVLSPGINLGKSKFKKHLLKNKKKIITDIDLFFSQKPKGKTIVVTGTNGKSTTCKILEHVFKKNRKKVQLGGNIGKPVLDFDLRIKSFFIIEASSYQLAYSKTIKPNFALILNIAKDHLDWHKSFKNYKDSKLKIFSNQSRSDYALINNKNLIKTFKAKKNKGKLKEISINSCKKVIGKIKNKHLTLKSNEENVAFVYQLSKILKINEKSFLRSLESFKGLSHRYEIFYKKKKVTFINDSKATSFEATKFALLSNKNILWIVGGLPKLKDTFNLKSSKHNIIKSYIIGNYAHHYKKQLKGKIKFEVSKTLNKAVHSIFKLILNKPNDEFTVLLSPASASFDQFKNFEERGKIFKNFVKYYGKKYF